MPLTLSGTNGVSGVDGTAGTPAVRGGDANTGIVYGTDTVSIVTGGTERVQVNSSGQTLVPDGSATAPAITNSGDENTGIFFPAADTIAFAEGGVESVRFDSGGNVLVGTTTTSYGSISGRFISSSPTSGGAGLFYTNFSGDLSTSALNIGKFDNNTTTSQIFVKFGINNAGLGSGQINANGSSQVAFGSFSDARLKENITDLPPQLSNILALRPVEFDYIATEGGGHQIGFIAQEMQTVYPDAVGEREDGMLTITAWSKTEARFVKAIQELSAKLDAAEARIAALEAN